MNSNEVDIPLKQYNNLTCEAGSFQLSAAAANF